MTGNQGSSKGASMTEPVAYIDWQQRRGAPLSFFVGVAVQAFKASATRDDVTVRDAMLAALNAVDEALAHPAPAPAEGCGACPDACEGGECRVIAESPPAGVPDVISQLIECCNAWEPSVCILGNVRAGEAATALAALQSQNDALQGTFESYNTIVSEHAQTIQQQAERITTLQTENECLAASCRAATENNDTLKAMLAEAVEVFRWLNMRGGLGLDVHERISVAIQKAREVMG